VKLTCGREVLLARRLVGIGGGRVLTICHQSSAVAAGKLFPVGVAIVDRDEDTGAHGCGKPRHIAIREQGTSMRSFRFGMDAVAIEDSNSSAEDGPRFR